MNTVLCFALLVFVCLAYALALPYPDEMIAQLEGLQAEESRNGGWGHGGGGGGHGGGHGGGYGQGGGYGRGGGWGNGGGWGHG